MKSKQRHDMKKNELEETLEQVLAFMRKNGSRVLAVIILIVVIVGAFIYIQRTNQIARAQSWEQLLSAKMPNSNIRPNDIRRMAEQSSDPKFAAFAWLQLGDILLDKYMLDDKADKKQTADKCIDAYSKVIDNYAEEKDAYANAKFGLGILYENTGKWDKARQIYQELEKDSSLSGAGIIIFAKNRLINLDNWEKTSKTKLVTTKPAATQSTQPAGK